MATAESTSRSQERHTKIRPFAWMKRLANLKSSSSESNGAPSKKSNGIVPTKSKKSTFKRKEPYPSSSNEATHENANLNGAVETGLYTQQVSYEDPSIQHGDHQREPASSRSGAATLDSNAGTIHSEGGYAKSGTTHTYGGGKSSISGGGNSIFSSSNHSSRSLTTTLTTIQSNGPPGTQQGVVGNQPNINGYAQANSNTSPSSAYFSHQYPTTPASAVPAHLQPAPQAHVPTTYRSAIANNLLTDNASIITLASSTNRRQRRNSLDTNASVRAIPPSSVWGGSRESLPLSVLSQTADSITGPTPSQSGGQGSSSAATHQAASQRPSVGPSVERASVYSSGGVAAPALSSERNSIYAGKTSVGGQDGASSIRSGLVSHGRNDSTAGSIGGLSSPLTSPRDAVGSSQHGRLSRRSSDWKEGLDVEDSEDDGSIVERSTEGDTDKVHRT